MTTTENNLNIFNHIPSQVFCSTDGNTTFWYWNGRQWRAVEAM